ncbi:MAG: hypothetical protein RL329_2406 [Bacteroidota bacterium]|jgi:hypothetical protein
MKVQITRPCIALAMRKRVGAEAEKRDRVGNIHFFFSLLNSN